MRSMTSDVEHPSTNGSERTRPPAASTSSRPILDEDERAEVMAALESVTFVTVFDDVSPRETIVAVAPDVLVKGGDWGVDHIIGREEVEASGGRVLSLPFVDGCSTSEVVARIVSGQGAP